LYNVTAICSTRRDEGPTERFLKTIIMFDLRVKWI